MKIYREEMCKKILKSLKFYANESYQRIGFMKAKLVIGFHS